MIARIESFFRRFRRRMSRSEWGLRFFGLSPVKGPGSEPGLLIIQIDGLSRPRLESALASGRMPFIKRLLQKQNFELRSFYSGLPSSTPGVQAELFYGVKGAVPAFSFFNRKSGHVVRMFEADAAREIEQELRKQGEGLLEGGSSYANIYQGGARESHFCAPNLGWDSLIHPGRFRAYLGALILNSYGALRVLVLLLVEFVLAIFDFGRGLIAGQDFLKELKFVPSRVGVSILLRELIVFGAQLDMSRGLPVIHLNLLGYDEQAHRRGPSSLFAFWSLKGIDDAIKRLYGTARRSHRRDYAVWIFSDHGQEETTPFAREQGRPLQDVVAEILQEPPPVIPIRSEEKVGIRSNRGYWGERRKEVPQTPLSTGGNEPGPKQLKLIIAAMGPLGHVYYDKPMTLAEKMKHARNLVARGGIPLVFFLDEKGNVYVADAEDSHQLPAEIATVIGNDHPFQEEIATDLIRICRHEHAGDFILSGWRWDKKALSFPEENGAHAGPGVNETHGFILLPPATLVGASPGKYLRGEVVRAAALHHLKRTFLPPEVHFPEIRGSKDSLRILTYNIHSCIGMDGRISPERIARVIAQHQPDIVALQEVDVGRRRTHRIDQAHVIAECMKMNYHFHPAFEIEEEQYGLALLSHYPMTHIKAGRLPGLSHRPRREPRGALLVEIAYHDRGIRLLNTHLGLSSKERRAQVTALMSEQWLHELEDDVPLIICGDMNAGPSSFPHLCLSRRFFDVQALLESHTPMNTFFARNPMLRLDHVFVSSHFQVLSVDVARTDLTRVASDHLPLLTEVKLVSENEPARAL